MAEHLASMPQALSSFLALQTEQYENQSGWPQVQLANNHCFASVPYCHAETGSQDAWEDYVGSYVHVCIWACMYVSTSSSEVPSPLWRQSSWPGAHQLGMTASLPAAGFQVHITPPGKFMWVMMITFGLMLVVSKHFTIELSP